MNFAALVEYDGSAFSGFQRQAPGTVRTVQGEIESGLTAIAGEVVKIEAAGRTDTGVHASGQVIQFRVESRLGADDWRRALNAMLPGDVSVRAVRVVDESFRARWSASARSYRYRIVCDAVRSPLRERLAWRVPGFLDVDAMRLAAATLLGEHDFAAFGSSPRDQRNLASRAHTVRTVTQSRCAWSAEWPDEVECDFTANGFLTGMVRRIVGTLALVGEGRLTVEQFRAILAARDKAHIGASAPARGLCLTGVTYPPGLVEW